MGRDIIIVAGAIGRSRIGGKAWAYMQYLIGLQRLGYDVFYLEDCGEGSWVYDWDTQQTTTDLDYPASYVRDCIEQFGFKDRWIYRAGDHSKGMAVEEFLSVCSQASLLIIRANPMPIWRPEYDWPKRRVFIDVDPGFTQIRLVNNDAELLKTVKHSERLFTIGQNIGNPDCPIPTVGRDWFKTVPPISLPDWPFSETNPAENFTCVMDWRGFHDVVYKGVSYGQKDKTFPEFLELPRLTSQPILLAQIGANPEQLAKHGWEVMPGWVPSFTPWSYRTFIQNSRAEFGVAKHMYVETCGGWFSDRSVCYLASGRPVLVQDTGQKGWLPIGEGILTFRDLPEALQGIEAINADYEHHQRAARALAEHFFSADRVLSSLLEAAMN